MVRKVSHLSMCVRGHSRSNKRALYKKEEESAKIEAKKKSGLLPCPFCGGRLVVRRIYGLAPKSINHWPTCKTKDCVINGFSRYYVKRKFAVEAINRRVNEQRETKTLSVLWKYPQNRKNRRWPQF